MFVQVMDSTTCDLLGRMLAWVTSDEHELASKRTRGKAHTQIRSSSSDLVVVRFLVVVHNFFFFFICMLFLLIVK